MITTFCWNFKCTICKNIYILYCINHFAWNGDWKLIILRIFEYYKIFIFFCFIIFWFIRNCIKCYYVWRYFFIYISCYLRSYCIIFKTQKTFFRNFIKYSLWSYIKKGRTSSYFFSRWFCKSLYFRISFLLFKNMKYLHILFVPYSVNQISNYFLWS